jgi:hypothetical protein
MRRNVKRPGIQEHLSVVTDVTDGGIGFQFHGAFREILNDPSQSARQPIGTTTIAQSIMPVVYQFVSKALFVLGCWHFCQFPLSNCFVRISDVRSK